MNLSSITSKYRGELIIKAYKNWIKKGDRILDVGCGTGIVSRQIADYFNVNMTGCDINNYLICNIPLLLIDKKYHIPVPNESFDIVMLNDVLHHVKKNDQKKLICETIRIAKRVLVFEFEPTISGKIFDIVLNFLHYNGLDTPLSFRKIPEWENLFNKLSVEFKIVKIKKPFWYYPFSHVALYLWKPHGYSGKPLTKIQTI